MANTNIAIVNGNVGVDPAVRKVGDTKVAQFSLATSHMEKETKVTDWHTIKAWGKLADMAEKYVKKGTSLLVEGSIRYVTFTDKEGTERKVTEILANRIDLGPSNEQRQERSERKVETQAEAPARRETKAKPDPMAAEEGLEPKDDDLPF